MAQPIARREADGAFGGAQRAPAARQAGEQVAPVVGMDDLQDTRGAQAVVAPLIEDAIDLGRIVELALARVEAPMADSSHFFGEHQQAIGLAQLYRDDGGGRFGPAAAFDIAQGRDHLDRVSVGVEQHTLARFEPAEVAVAVAQPKLDRWIGKTLRHARQAAFDDRQVIAVDQVGEPAPDHFDRGIARHAQRRAGDIEQAPVEPQAQDHVLGIVRDQPVTRLALLQRVLRPAACGDIGQPRSEAEHPAIFDLGIKVEFGISRGFSTLAEQEFASAWFHGGARPGPQAACRAAVGWRDHLEPAIFTQAGGIEARQNRPATIGKGWTSQRIEMNRARWRGFGKAQEQPLRSRDDSAEPVAVASQCAHGQHDEHHRGDEPLQDMEPGRGIEIGERDWSVPQDGGADGDCTACGQRRHRADEWRSQRRDHQRRGDGEQQGGMVLTESGQADEAGQQDAGGAAEPFATWRRNAVGRHREHQRAQRQQAQRVGDIPADQDTEKRRAVDHGERRGRQRRRSQRADHAGGEEESPEERGVVEPGRLFETPSDQEKDDEAFDHVAGRQQSGAQQRIVIGEVGAKIGQEGDGEQREPLRSRRPDHHPDNHRIGQPHRGGATIDLGPGDRANGEGEHESGKHDGAHDLLARPVAMHRSGSGQMGETRQTGCQRRQYGVERRGHDHPP